MDNLQIYLNKDEIIEIKGSMDLSEGEFIQARLISGNVDQFKLGYNIALEHLADLSGYPGNSIEERVKAELEE